MNLSASDVTDFAASAAGSLRAQWPSAVAAGEAVLDPIWLLAAEQGWFELGPVGELAAAMALTRELGRIACPFPLVDGYVAAWLAEPHPELVAAITSGAVRVIAAGESDGRQVRFAEAAPSATHVLLLAGDGAPTMHPIVGIAPTPGLADPVWHDVEIGPAESGVSLAAGRASAARAIVRLGLAARAAAAAERTHELAIEHAKTRTQFGRVIGGFGAVQQRTATAAIDASASRALLDLAIAAPAGDEFDFGVALAVGHVRTAGPRVQLAAHHTLAAIGYFDEHEGPWLFRRVHADVTRIGLFERAGETVGDQLVENAVGLPRVTVDDAPAEALRAELSDLFGRYAEQARTDSDAAHRTLRDAMVERGHFGMGWPPEHGGRGASVGEQVVLNDEIQYHGVPVRDEMSTVMLLGNAILRHGTADQQAEFLPPIRRGQIRFCLGYSEPEVGSDLASLRTRAVRDGDGWVINGQKAWTTNGHVATHIWLATRTDPDAQPRHAGITVFLVPMDTAGITVQQHRALSGEISCSVFFDDLRVGDELRVGEVNGGWKVITDALAGERVVMGSVAAILRRQFDEVLAVVRSDIDRHVGARDSARRARLGDLAVRLQATRALVARAVDATSGGQTNLAAPMAAVLGGEVAEEFGETLLELFGPEIALAGGAGWPQQIEYYLRLSIMYVVGGGTNDIQRGLIARALGLPPMTPVDAPDLGPDRLRTLFRPNRIAIVGASDKSQFSRTVVGNLVEFGFADRMYLVNRRSPTVHGRPAVATVADIGEPVDLAFTMVPQAATLDTLKEFAAAGIRNAVVLTSGYAEAGEAGREAQRQLVENAVALGMVVLGPNMLGFANFVDRVPVTPVPNLPQGCGHVALLSQSGASSSAMLEFANTAGVELSHLVTLGNEAMITAGHALDFVVDDEHTRVVAIFMETVRQPDVFRRAARRALAAGKAIVVLKAGRSELAARTAAAHTGALVGDDATTTAVFDDLGVIRVNTIEDMLVTAGAAAHLGRLARPGVGVVSISGGACDIVADLAADAGLPLPALAAPTIDALTAVMPSYGTVQNPLDVTGAAVIDPPLSTACIAALAADPSIGAILAINKIPWQAHEDPFGGQQFIDAIGAGAIMAAPVPVIFVNQVMQPITATTKAVLERGRVPYAICGLAQAVTAMRAVGWWSQRASAIEDERPDVAVPPAADRHGVWSEHQARTMLADAGVPVVPSVLARSGDEAAAAAGHLGGAVAVKVVSAEIMHKSDIGGVRLDVDGPDAARAAFEAVTAAGRRVDGATIEGALVSPMRPGGVELLVGVVRDPQWGPILAVAIGGVLVEVLGDAALAPLPVGRDRIRQLISSLRGRALLDGFRGGPPADVAAVVDAIGRIADLASALGDDLESLEVNPLRVDGDVIEALDAVVTWRDRPVRTDGKAGN